MSVPTIVMDNAYDRIHENLPHGHRFVMFKKAMYVLQGGAMLGIICGQRRPVCKASTFGLASTPDIIRISMEGMQGTIEDGNAYLDHIVALAREKGFPLYAVNLGVLNNGPEGPFDRHVLDVSREKFDGIIDCYREVINSRVGNDC